MEEYPNPDGQLARSPKSGRSRAVAIWANRVVYWISRHWLGIINSIVALYVGLAFAAPVLMHVGAERPASMIYAFDSAACHQMGFRSWFLFGEQAYYPLEATGIKGVRYFEEYVADEPGFAGVDSKSDFFAFSWVARSFKGNELMGYKVALCERDVALYLSLLLGGLLFSLFRRWLPPLKWPFFVLFGALPMAIDGGYQLLSYFLSSAMPGLLPIRETTPFLRTITGALFGFGLFWMTYPQIEMGMRDTEQQVRTKLVRAGLLKEKTNDRA